MQFREQGKRIQVLAYRGYDKEKRRAQVKLLGSFDRYGFGMSDGLMDNLTDDEKLELQSHIENMRQSQQSAIRGHAVRQLASRITEVSDSLTDEAFASRADREYATEVYAAIDVLTKRLRKLGFRRLAREPITVATE